MSLTSFMKRQSVCMNLINCLIGIYLRLKDWQLWISLNRNFKNKQRQSDAGKNYGKGMNNNITPIGEKLKNIHADKEIATINVIW